MMSRKHYREAADMVREVLMTCNTYAAEQAAADVARGLARMFKRDNGRFSFGTFYEACGLDEAGRVKERYAPR